MAHGKKESGKSIALDRISDHRGQVKAYPTKTTLPPSRASDVSPPK